MVILGLTPSSHDAVKVCLDTSLCISSLMFIPPGCFSCQPDLYNFSSLFLPGWKNVSRRQL